MRGYKAAIATLCLVGLGACETPAPQPAGAMGSTGSQASGMTAGTRMPAGLTSEERFLWGTMTPEAQVQAAAYIRNGGTLTQFMAL